ncbi:hypothetical protein Y032_0419g1126 [Ancylostoma ceylanicum]|uniref:Uncharacterized protein n=1 Tax=Ancylostoma ceylanicum TaxID=53326 RepID=A0A016X1B2_9BILA|nr:hypothetical protein Y032_0419g1126 [Ancylostoma ceylanicum]
MTSEISPVVVWRHRPAAAVASGIGGGPTSPTRKTSWSTLIEGSNRRYSIAQLVFGNSTLVRGSSGQLRDYWPDDDADSTGSAGHDAAFVADCIDF